MGIDNSATKFIFAAHAAGVSFQKTVTLGRQDFAPDADILQKLLDSGRPGLSAKTFLAESKNRAEKLFEHLGAYEVVAIDNSDYEGADVVADLNEPINPELRARFSAVFDGGCLEHIFNFPQAIHNCMQMLAVGGHFVAITPANNCCGHGFYQFSPELFFRVFSEANGFIIRALLIEERGKWYRVVDPKKLGGRSEMQNSRPTFLFVVAKKTAETRPFAPFPQQSDYVNRWQKELPTKGILNNPGSWRNRMRSLIPHSWKEAIRPLAANLPLHIRFECYEEIDEARMLKGVWQ